MATVPISKASRNLSHWVNRAGYSGETVVLTSHGKPKAVILGIDSFESLLGVTLIDEEELPSASEIRREFKAALKAAGINNREETIEMVQQVKREMAAEKDHKE